MDKKQNTKYSNKGFTLIEVIVAAGIFSVFCVGLFSFYKMGSDMFLKGSWKLRRQKDAERFLSRLKERIEQASNATKIDYTIPDQIIRKDAPFIIVNKDTKIGTGTPVVEQTDIKKLMLFSVCKPDISKQGLQKGLKLHQSLMLDPDNPKIGEKQLYTLYHGSSKGDASIGGIDFFNSSVTYSPDVNTWNFSASPLEYSLGKDDTFSKLADVSWVEVSWQIADGNDPSKETPKVIILKIGLQHPKFPETKIQQQIQAKLDYAVKLQSFALGGF